MLYSQLFLFYIVIFHPQCVHCSPETFAHLLKGNLQWDIAAGPAAGWQCSGAPGLRLGPALVGAARQLFWGFGGWGGEQGCSDGLWVFSTPGVPTQTEALQSSPVACRAQGRQETATAPKGSQLLVHTACRS